MVITANAKTFIVLTDFFSLPFSNLILSFIEAQLLLNGITCDTLEHINNFLIECHIYNFHVALHVEKRRGK